MQSDKSVESNSVQIVEGSTSGTFIKRVTVTETSSRLSVNSSLNTSLEEEEEWERKPKTDYTYAKTASYMKFSPTKGYPNPNMARRGLHGQALYEASHQSMENEDTFFSSTRVLSNTQLQEGDDFGALSPIVGEGQVSSQAVNRNNANSEAGMSREQRRSRGGADPRQSQYYRYPESTTRSGTFYGVKERLMKYQNRRNSRFTESTVTRELDFDEPDSGQGGYTQGKQKSHKFYEKQMEYAGESIPYKEAQTPLHNLYGLDRADVAHDVTLEGDSRSEQSVGSVVTTTTAVIKSVVNSTVSGLYRLAKTVGTWLYTFLSYVLVLIVFLVTQGIPSVASSVIYITRQTAAKLAQWTTSRSSSLWCWIREGVVTAHHRVYGFVTACCCYITAPFTSAYHTVSTLWASPGSSQKQQISPTGSVTTSTTKEVLMETTLQRRRKSAYRPQGAEGTTQIAPQGTSHTHTLTEEDTEERRVNRRNGIFNALVNTVLFVPSLVYGYILFPCYLLVCAVVDSVRFGSTGLVASLKYCYTSITHAPGYLLSYISSLWSSKSQIRDHEYQSTESTSATEARKSPRLRKSVTFDVQEGSTQSTGDLHSEETQGHLRDTLLKVLMFLPNSLYAYVWSPVWSGIHSVCTSVWSFISSVYHTVVCGTTNVMTGVGSVFTNAYNRVSSVHLWRQETSVTDTRKVMSKSVKQQVNRRQSARLRKQLEFSDTEDVTDSEGEAAYTESGQYAGGSRYLHWLYTGVMLVPWRFWDLVKSVGRVCSGIFQGCWSFVCWLFVEKLGGMLLHLGSNLTQKSSASSTASASSVTVETTLSDIDAAKMSGASKRKGDVVTASVVQETVSMSTRNQSTGHGFAIGWCDTCLQVLLFLPRLVFGVFLNCWHLVKYLSGAAQACTHWLFVESLGNFANSSKLWMSEKLRTFSSYLIITDVWIISRSRRCGLCCLLPLLLLIPFLLCGSYYVYEQGRDAVVGGVPIGSILAGSTEHSQVTDSDSTSSSGWFPWLLLAGWFQSSNNKAAATRDTVTEGSGTRDHTASAEETPTSGSDSTPVGGGLYLSEEELQAKMREVFLSLYNERESEAQSKSEQAKEQILLQQTQVFNQFRLDVEGMTKHIVKEELANFAVGLNTQRAEDLTRHTELVKEHTGEAEKIRQLQEQYAALLTKSEAVTAEIQAARHKMTVQDEEGRAATQAMVSKLEGRLAALQADITALQGAQTKLMAELRTCCKNDSALALLVRNGVREQLAGFMSGAMGGGGHTDGTTFLGGTMDSGSSEESSHGSAFTMWLQNQFAKRDDLDSKIAALAAKLNEQIKAESETAARAAVVAAGVGDNSEAGKTSNVVVMGNGTGLSEEQVKLLIREALYVFGADKTGMVDYALESAGGSVISTRCSETYHRRTAQLSLFGIPLWYTSNSPRTVIQPEVHPGQCWAFRGSHGYLVVHLAGVVKPTAFSLEHIPKSLSPTGKIDSAPRHFSVRGLSDETDKEGLELGEYEYDHEGEPLQYFTVQNADAGAFPIVELMISSNWGNEEYTCLYRFRVHGQLHKWTPDS